MIPLYTIPMTHHEIDRKFLIEKMPFLFWRRPVLYERYFLQHGDLVEERIQKYGNIYEYELKTAITPQEWSREKRFITKEEFNVLKGRAGKAILREHYLLTKKSPRISINKYKGDYRGLTFAEVEFDTKEERDSFDPPDWMGTEITTCPLGRDSWLLDMDREHFLKALDTEMDNLNIGSQSFN